MFVIVSFDFPMTWVRTLRWSVVEYSRVSVGLIVSAFHSQIWYQAEGSAIIELAYVKIKNMNAK